MGKIRLGLAPTRRSIFSAPDAVKYANLTRKRLKQLDGNLLISKISTAKVFCIMILDREKVAQKFKREKIDAAYFCPTATLERNILQPGYLKN